MTYGFKKELNKLYSSYNKFEYIHPDPLEFVHRYKNKQDQEIVGLLASSLAYGKVSQILKSIEKVLSIIGNSPREFISNKSKKELSSLFSNFKHRFTTGDEISYLLLAIKGKYSDFETLNDFFVDSYKRSNFNFLASINLFSEALTKFFPEGKSYLIPMPKSGSACKRLMLYFRWMIRKDDVDLGCWQNIDPSNLIIPLDTHMHYISNKLGFTNRRNADFKTAIEITENFKKIDDQDPTRYDFVLTRFGIRDDFEYPELFKRLGKV